MTNFDRVVSVGLVGAVAFLLVRATIYLDMLSLGLLVPVVGLIILLKILSDKAHIRQREVEVAPDIFKGATGAVDQATRLLGQSVGVASKLNKAMHDLEQQQAKKPTNDHSNWLDAIPAEYRDVTPPDYSVLLGSGDNGDLKN